MIAALAQLAVAQGPRLILMPKQVQAPPSDILSGVVRLPDPDATAIESTYARIPIVLTRTAAGDLEWTGDVPIDTGANVRMMVVHPRGAAVTLDVAPPAHGTRSTIRAAQLERSELEELDGAPDAELRTFDLGPAGDWHIRIRADRSAAPPGAPLDAWVWVASDSPHRLRTMVRSRTHIPGEQAILTADLRTDVRSAESALLTSVTADVDGRTLDMLDDGAHGDGAPGDGVYGLIVPLDAVGIVDVRIEATGITDSGHDLVRTSDQRIFVAPGGVAIAPQDAAAQLSPDPGAGGSQVRIDVPITIADPTRRTLVAAELWGVDPATGAPKPAVWAAMITEPHALESGAQGVSLFADRNWLATASVTGPFELRSIRVHDLDTFVPVAVRDSAPVRVAAGLALPQAAPRVIERSMMTGVPRADCALEPTLDPEVLASALTGERAFGAHNLILSHGYCAGGSPWPPADFTGYTEAFSDPNQNRTHDQFAQLILALGFGSKSYGIVCHSQGGCAALHLWTFYFSGLDWAEGPRLIQSLGTPYQGTPLASLGGFSCGVNNDMTPAGSATWLSTIPSAERSAVWYWTTSFTSSWCNFLANLVLSSPNDGVVEVARGQLPGAHSMGNTTGWCHTTGMSYPAQYTDTVRNATMNSNAAR